MTISGLQVDEIDITKYFAFFRDRLRIVERRCNQIIEIDALDIKNFLDMGAAVSQQLRHLLLVLRAIELSLYGVRRSRHLAKRQRRREDFDKHSIHKKNPMFHFVRNAARSVQPETLGFEVFRDFAAILSKLLHHLLVQPDVHRR